MYDLLGLLDKRGFLEVRRHSREGSLDDCTARVRHTCILFVLICH